MADNNYSGAEHGGRATGETTEIPKASESSRSSYYMLLLLTGILAVNQLDRHVLNICLDAIGREFALTDTQLGLLSGFLFTAVYVLFGFPVAKLAARYNRRNIIAAAALVWCSLTIVSGAAQSFLQLALARLGVGVGESGCVAPSQAIISDLYPTERRATAMGIYTAGSNIGILLAFLIGGVVGQVLGWRWAFIFAGLPGIVLAALLWRTTREPVRRDMSQTRQTDRSLFAATIKRVWSDKILFHILMGFAISGVVTYGALTWYATFIIRFHGLTQAQTGIFIACTVGVLGSTGTVLAGRIADRLGRADPRWRIGVVIFGLLAAKPFALTFLLASNTAVALSALAIATIFANTLWGPTFALIHGRVDNEMRTMATSVYMFAFNMVGLGLGPTIVGLASDTVFSGAGTRALAYALVCVQIAGIWGAWHFWKVIRLMVKPA